MPKYEYKAFTPEGKIKEGVITAENRDVAFKILQDQGLLVTYLTRQKSQWLVSLQKPGLKDVYLFTRQLSFLVKAKTPLDDAIKSLAETTTKISFRSMLNSIHDDLVSGIPFSQALSRFPNVFDTYYIGMIKVGESVGVLDEILDYLANHLNNQIRFRNKIIQASIYPIAVIVLFLAILLALFYFIIPRITSLFVENNIPLPLITKIFQGISYFLIKFGLIILIVLAALGYYLNQYFRTREGRVALFKMANGIPIFGPLIKNIYSAQFLESLYYLTKGGVPIVEALTIVKSSIAHPLYETALDSILEEVKKGKPLSEALMHFPDLFSNLIIEGMKTSEKTGQLAEIIFTIFSFYNDTVEGQVANLSEALQPVLTILLGVGLGLLEASLLVPLLQLTKYVQSF